MSVQTWADNFGNWHALVTGDTRDGGMESAYVAIRDELKARMNPDHFGEDRFRVTLVFTEGNQTEWVETWEGEIPTGSDVVTCGECGKSFPPNVAPSARCPFEYDHEIGEDEDFIIADSADLEVTYTDGHKEIISGVRFQTSTFDPNPIKCVNGVVSVETDAGLIWNLVGVRKFRLLFEGE